MIRHGARAPRYLVLWLTTACNLGCRYCYRPIEPDSDLPAEAIERAIVLAASSGQPFHLQLAGGEPCLKPELIAKAGALLRQHSPGSSLALQTNGTLLDDALLRICVKYRIAIGLSLDGPSDVQEHLRGEAGKTFRALNLLNSREIEFNVTCAVSSLNAGRLKDLAVLLAGCKSARAFGLDPLLPRGSARANPDLLAKPGELERGARELARVLQSINAARKISLRWREGLAVRQALFGRTVSSHFCQAGIGQAMCVHPSGAVYPCAQSVGIAGHQAGTLDSIDFESLAQLHNGRFLNGDCLNCPLEGRCPGDCPSRVLAFGNSAQPMCALYRGVAYACLKQGEPICR